MATGSLTIWKKPCVCEWRVKAARTTKHVLPRTEATFE